MYSEPFSIRSIGDYAPQSTPNVRQRRSLVCLYRYGAGTLARRHPGKAFRQGIQAGRQAGRQLLPLSVQPCVDPSVRRPTTKKFRQHRDTTTNAEADEPEEAVYNDEVRPANVQQYGAALGLVLPP
mmetsp:Transcript_69731/g.111550  ORF Transcript_69731/g.111550 Transcript_69731/m.111550 type:complete len:126 (+) Transcript_69731:1457-1834(+)